MLYSEYKEKCHKARSEKFNHLCFDKTKNKDESNYRIFNESKNTYIERNPESEPSHFFKFCSPSKTDKK